MGSAGASSGAKMAQTTATVRTTRENIGAPRKVDRNHVLTPTPPTVGDPCGTSSGMPDPGLSTALPLPREPDARVKPGVGHVHQDVDGHHECRGKEDHRLHHGKIPHEDRIHEQSSHPGQAKMVSVTTAPEMSWLKLTANSVKMGMEAFFRACFQSTVRLGIPFARTSLMASESKTSNMLERTIRICAATNSQPNVREGRMSPFGPKRSGPPALGSQPR